MTEIPEGTFPRHFKNTKTMRRKQAEEIAALGSRLCEHGDFLHARRHIPRQPMTSQERQSQMNCFQLFVWNDVRNVVVAGPASTRVHQAQGQPTPPWPVRAPPSQYGSC